VKPKTPKQKLEARRLWWKNAALDFGVYLVCIGAGVFRVFTPDLSQGIYQAQLSLPRWEAIVIGGATAIAAMVRAELQGTAPGRRASFRRRAQFAIAVGIASLATFEKMLGGM